MTRTNDHGAAQPPLGIRDDDDDDDDGNRISYVRVRDMVAVRWMKHETPRHWVD